MHKSDILLRPVVSSIGSPCNALAGFLHKILSPLVRKSESHVKNFGHFVELLKPVNLQSVEIEISSIMAIHWWKSILQVKAIMELLEVCLRVTYFQVDDKSFNRKMAWLWEALYQPSLATST
jgi:hypothetical protein